MTRETKIGLLVGLAFIIVIGILLADYSAKGSRPPQAAMGGAQQVRQSTRTLGPQPRNVPPELNVPVVEQRQPVNIEGNSGAERMRVRIPDPPGGPPRDVRIDDPGRGTGENARDPAGSTPPTSERVMEDRPLVPGDGSGLREHTAVSGDTVYRMARKYLGSPTKANCDAIIKLNPTLTAPPHRVDIGKVYRIPPAPTPQPTREAAATPPAQPALAPERSVTPVPTAPVAPIAVATVSYVTRPGDNLWKIAVGQCGSGSNAMVARIREMNKDVLRGSDVIQPNISLKLPARQVASR